MPVDIKDADFQTSVIEESKNKPILVDFWAPWCGPCKMLAPILEEVAKDLGQSVNILKINVDDNPLTASSLGIRSIPTMIVFRNGIEVERAVGILNRDGIINLIKKHQ